MIFDKYPYTNFHQMNDDWVIKTLREFGQRLDEFVAANQLTYADPIEYNPATQYPASTVVVSDETAYVSKQAVPAGILPTADSEYWLLIFPFGHLVDDAVDDMQAQIDAALAAAQEQLQTAINGLPATVNAWMAAHPDVTTTVPLNSINWQKLCGEMQAVILADYIKAPEGQEIIFTEQGGLYNGSEYQTPAYCRTGFLHFPVGIVTFYCAIGYLVRIYRYDADGTFINYTDVGFGTTQSTLGYTAIAVHADEQYRLTITINGGTALTPADIPFATVLYNSYTERQLPDLNDKLTALEVVGTAAVTDGLPYQDMLPAYYFAMQNNPASYADADSYLDGIISTAIDGKHLIFVTDSHQPDNSHISQELMQYVRSKINVERVVFGGDVLNRDSTPYIAYQTMSAYFNKCIAAFGASYLPAFGNHDLNTANTPNADATRMDIGVAADLYTKHLVGYVHFEESKDYGAVTGDNMLIIMRTIVDNKITADPTIPATLGMTRDEIVDAMMKYNRLHYYVDDDVNKTRYIIYNTGAPDNIVVKKILGVESQEEINLQTNWMYETLMSTPTGYDVVVCAHKATYDPNAPSGGTCIGPYTHYNLIGQLSCIKMKARMNSKLTAPQSAAINPDWMSTSTAQLLDFTNAPDVGKIVHLVGHWHYDYALKGYFFRAATGSGGVYTCFDYKGETIESGSVIDESNGVVLIIGTVADKNKTTGNVQLTGVDEDAIDIVTLAADTVELKRIGHSWNYSDGTDPGEHTNPITRTYTIS